VGYPFKTTVGWNRMRSIYIQANEDNVPVNQNCYAAYEGFRLRGEDVRLFSLEPSGVVPFGLSQIVSSSLSGEIVVHGTIPVVQRVLEELNVSLADVEDYPASLEQYLGRRVWLTTLGEVRDCEELWPVFIKPYQFRKAFTGHVVTRFADLLETNTLPDSFPIWASEPVRFEAEWRVFVLEGRILDVRLYKGSRWVAPIRNAVVDMLARYEESGTAPVAYALDVGLASDEMLLVEVNRGYSLGTYGLDSTLYAQMIEALWKHLVPNGLG
jgi:hypothetical protein